MLPNGFHYKKPQYHKSNHQNKYPFGCVLLSLVRRFIIVGNVFILTTPHGPYRQWVLCCLDHGGITNSITSSVTLPVLAEFWIMKNSLQPSNRRLWITVTLSQLFMGIIWSCKGSGWQCCIILPKGCVSFSLGQKNEGRNFSPGSSAKEYTVPFKWQSFIQVAEFPRMNSSPVLVEGAWK